MMFNGITGKVVHFLLPMMIITAMGSSAIVAAASEGGDSIGEFVTDSQDVAEPDYTVYEKEGEDSEGKQGSSEDSVTDSSLDEYQITLYEESLDESVMDSSGYDVCFYIRNDVENAEIPDEPQAYPSSYYSEAIRVNNALSENTFVYDTEINENIYEDGITAINLVSETLNSFPDIEEIKAVYPSFDQNTQYVYWYVIKNATTPSPNQDVKIHVDGIVLDKTQSSSSESSSEAGGESSSSEGSSEAGGESSSSEGSSEAGGESSSSEGSSEVGSDSSSSESSSEAGSDSSSSESSSEAGGESSSSENSDDGEEEHDLEFEIYTENFEPEFEYDGNEHLIGGYVIRVIDLTEGTATEFCYSATGEKMNVISFFANFLRGGIRKNGTTITYLGKNYNISVDGAYLWVKNPGSYEIPLMFNGSPISASEITIRDEAGKVIQSNVAVSATTTLNAVHKRKITIEAGSTVQNDNGTTLTNSNVSITSGSLVEGHQLKTTILGSQTGPGSSVNEITSWDIVDENGNSCKDMYDVTKVNGKLVLVETKSADNGSRTDIDTSSVIVGKNSDKLKDFLDIISSVGKISNDIITTGNNGEVVIGGVNTDEGETYLAGASYDTEKKQQDFYNYEGTFENGDIPMVLGARRSATEDSSVPAGVRAAIVILCAMLASLIYKKKVH